jgi:hypothetical protein
MKREKLLKTSLRSAGEYVIEAKQLAGATEANYLRCLKQLVAFTDDKVQRKEWRYGSYTNLSQSIMVRLVPTQH